MTLINSISSISSTSSTELSPAKQKKHQASKSAKKSGLKSKSKGARPKSLKVRMQLWLRSWHIYSSMGSLLLILFFSLSGILLNHPEWIPQSAEKWHDYQGKVQVSWLDEKNTDWLNIVESVRAEHDLRGRASEFQNDGEEATFVFRAPGTESSIILETDSGAYTVSHRVQGLAAIIGDLHRGNNTGPSWKWIIDISAGFLVFISLTGFGILLYLKKHRRKALFTLAGGSVMTLLAVLFLGM